MKKLVVTVLSLLSCSVAYALPVGNPADASLLCDGIIWEGHCGDSCDPSLSWCDAWSFRIGFYGDYVFNRHLQGEDVSPERVVEHTEIYTNAGYLAFNLWNRFDLFAALGASQLSLQGNNISLASPVRNPAPAILESTTDFSWSVGARATLWECGCTTFGAEAQYFQTQPKVRIIGSPNNLSYVDDIATANYQEWQVGLGMAYRIHVFVPYVAVKWSHARATFDHFAVGNSFVNNFESQKDWGYAVGVSLIVCDRISLTGEGRFGDEKACYVNGQIRF